jgi:hypothetical protein
VRSRRSASSAPRRFYAPGRTGFPGFERAAAISRPPSHRISQVRALLEHRAVFRVFDKVYGVRSGPGSAVDKDACFLAPVRARCRVQHL